MDEWREYQLKDVCSRLSSGKNIKSREVLDKGKYPVYGGNGLRGYSDKANFSGECAIIGRQGAYCGNVRYFSGTAYMTEHAIVTVANENNSTRFLAYLLSMMHLGRLSGQSAQPGLSVKTLGQQIVKLPSYKLQNQIASVLTILDDKIEINNQINKNLEEQAKAILTHLLEVSEDSTLARLGDYLYIKGRIGWKGLKKSEYLNHSDYRIINGESLTTSGIDWDKTGYISKVRYDESPEIMLQIGDILLSKDGTIGKIGYVNQLDAPTSVASGIFVIRNTKPDIISTPFIYYLLKSSLFNSFVAGRTEGSVIPHLYQKDFKEFEFPLPSKKEMSTFDDLIGPQFEKFFANQVENEYLAKLRGTLLPKLMSGEIDVSALEF